MALLIINIDANTIRIIGMWHSNKMLCYLLVTVRRLM